MWTIDKNIPIPPRQTAPNGVSTGLTRVLLAMEVGDSVFVSDERGGLLTASSAQSYVQGHHGRKFTRRKVDGGARLWRMPDHIARR